MKISKCFPQYNWQANLFPFVINVLVKWNESNCKIDFAGRNLFDEKQIWKFVMNELLEHNLTSLELILISILSVTLQLKSQWIKLKTSHCVFHKVSFVGNILIDPVLIKKVGGIFIPYTVSVEFECLKGELSDNFKAICTWLVHWSLYSLKWTFSYLNTHKSELFKKRS